MRSKLKKLLAFAKDWRNQLTYLRWMVRYTRPFAASLALLLGFDIVASLLGVGGTVLNKYIIDGATAGGNIRLGIALLVGLTLVNIGFSALTGLISTYIHERYTFSIRQKVFSNVLRGRWQKVSAFHSGDLMTRLTSDVDSVASGIASIVPEFILLIVRLVSAFCVLYYYDRALALFALVLGPVGAVLSIVFTGKLAKYQEQLKQSESTYRSFLQETLANIVVTKAFRREEASSNRLSELRQERLKLVLDRNRVSALMGVLMRVTFSAGYLVAFGLSIARLSEGSITYGTMTVFLSLVGQVQGPIMGLSRTIPQFINILTSTKRVMEIDALEPEADSGKTDVPASVGLRMEGVDFAYDREAVLKNVNIDVAPGDVVGVVGYSGSGKTTLIRLAMALTRPDAGRVRFYGAGLDEEADAASRRFIAYVPQGNTLLSGTVADNLRAGRGDATEQQMWRALSTACAEDFVRALPEGLHTPIAERAGGLSEGQAQRVAIARALIRESPFLILDEATSALDEETESTLLRRLSEGGGTRTCLVITHRRSMLRYCTKAFAITDTQVTQHTIER